MSREEEENEEGGFYEQPNLGDLTRPLSHERNETWVQEGAGGIPPQSPGGRSQVADLARGTDIIRTTETERISKVAPALAYGVQSVYDARPIQGYDFQHSECDGIVWIPGGSGSEFDPVTFTYTVPDNVIAVLRSFRYQVTTAPINGVTEGGCWLASTLLVNGQPVREYNQMLHPVFMRNFLPSFIIADERTKIQLTLSMAILDGVLTEFFSDLRLNSLVSPVLAEFYGNIILKTGIPKEFEIANPLGGSRL